MRSLDYARLPTEQRNPASARLDRMPLIALLRLMNREDRKVVDAVGKTLKQVAAAAQVLSKAVASGGRTFFVGAGTSGRLGVLEAAEMPPTFHTSPSLFQALMAGGKSAVFHSKEGAEDDAAAGKREILAKANRGDVVIGIAASGVTPYVKTALTAAKKKGASTVFITCNPSVATNTADVVIAVHTGPEVLSGSTRLKAATATKMVLNMITLGAMVGFGKVYGNLMVDLEPKSRKLVERGLRILREISGVSRREGLKYFKATGGRVKVAADMIRKKNDRQGIGITARATRRPARSPIAPRSTRS